MRALLAAFAIACAAPAPALDASPARPGARVLFVGNSLTEGNNLPGMVAVLSAAAGVPLQVAAVTIPGAHLGDHLDAGSARRLETGRWDFVVLQQGPTSRPESRDQLVRDAGRWAKLIRAAGGRPALFMVWPIRDEPEWFDGVHENYALAAERCGGLFLPAGESWRIARRLDPKVALYSPDGLHPTPTGSYAAALVIFAGLTGRSPRGAPALDGMSPETADLLQRAAEQSLAP
jgi:hypothetical protein